LKESLLQAATSFAFCKQNAKRRGAKNFNEGKA
jgi:hypothetical protein